MARWRAAQPPRRLVARASRAQQAWALILISMVVYAGLTVAALAPGEDWSRPLMSMIACALLANSLWQATVSAVSRKPLPGTASGLALMLPPALWLLRSLDWPLPQAMCGALLAPPVLLLVWLAARQIAGTDS